MHTFLQGQNTYIAGHFNTYHPWWSGDQAVLHYDQIRKDRTPANTIVQWLNNHGMSMANKVGTYTFFSESSKSIIDQCFHRGTCTKMKQS